MSIGSTNLLKDLVFDRLVIGLGFSSKYINRPLAHSLAHSPLSSYLPICSGKIFAIIPINYYY